MITIKPENIPEVPVPAMARPTINEFEFGAAPQMAEPISKRMMPMRKTGLAG